MRSEPTITTEVLVVGAGAAGIAAAVAASRTGARVVVIERGAFTGGKATAAMVGTICGIYLRDGSEARYAMNGFPREFCEQLAGRSGTHAVAGVRGLWFLPYDYDVFEELGTRLLSEAGIELRTSTSIKSCHAEGDRLISVTARGQDGVMEIRASSMVDCTGTGLLAELSGAPMIRTQRYQRPAQVFCMRGVRANEEGVLNMAVTRAMLRADPKGRGSVSVVPGSLRDGQVCLKIAFSEQVEETTDLDALQASGQLVAKGIAALLKADVEAFHHADVSIIAPEVGVRTQQRAQGRYTLEQEDVMTCRKFVDGVANGAWPIEFWGAERNVAMRYFEEGEHYQVPVGALRAATLSNLFLAGRTISATEEAIASARVIGTCLGTGYAAGVLAAAAALRKDMDAAIESVRRAQVYI
ncbi:MAG: FAD-dependent oxidoreductase [Flavobacteriales bacterium]|nr:FAD-dependent oxidoreductase [Flavobacteriales bacterium]MBP6696957.1 FAD-dependent oxidoreductase [Flavobacteriales bacterium]